MNRSTCLMAVSFSLALLPAICPADQGSPTTGETSKAAAGNERQDPAKKPGGSVPAQVGRPPEQPQEKPRLETTTIFEQTGVLTPKGGLVIEPSFQYIHSSSNQVALVGYTIIPTITIGLIDIKNVERNSFVTSLTARYGLTNRLEFEFRVPFVHQSDSTSTQEADATGTRNTLKVHTADGTGLGDIEFGLRYQLNQPMTGGPFFIMGVRAKSNTGKDPFEVARDPNIVGADGRPLATELPTGSGFWGFQPSLTCIFPSDPAVFFGSVSYMWNIDRGDIPGYGSVDPGDIMGFNFGMGLALNEKASVSIGYDHSVVGRVKINGSELPGSLVTQVGSLLIGYSYKYSEKTSFSLSLGAGLTDAAPNVQITLRVPISF